ncbi:hypothetical protein LCGC14_1907640 [marine sediment metagenome]|uniref:Uncharacterized protein n=1 Tax=marine sediment metagenome TaxID=412755 RepID=A0A0F9ISP9_9ZZZZ
MEGGSFPQEAINSREERRVIREERAALAEQQRQQELMLEAAKVAPGLAKGAEPNSPMEAIGAAV